jgi:PAS domain S-box-containing protein
LTSTKRKIEELETRYEALFDRTLYCVYVHDFEGNFLDANNTALNLLGYTRKEISSLNFSSLLDGDHLQKAVRATSDLLESGFQKSPIEYKIRKKDGTYIWVEAEASLLFKEGEPYAIQGIAKDITEQKRILEALSQSEERHRSLTSHLNVGVYRNTPGERGRFIEANPAIVKMFGCNSREEFLGMTVADFYRNPADRKMFNKKIQERGFVQNEELQLKKKDGTPLTGSVSAVAVRDSDGKIQYYDGIIEDISERKRSQKELEDSERKYRTLIEQSIQGIVIVQGIPPRLVFINPAVAEISEYPVEEISSLSTEAIESLIHPADRKTIFENYKNRLKGKKPSSHFEMRVIRKDNSVCWLEVHSKLIEYSGAPAVQAIFVDITDRKMAEHRTRELNRVLKRRIDERSERIGILLEARQRLQVEKNWEKGLKDIVEAMSRFGFDQAGIFLVNSLTKRLVFHYGKGARLPEMNAAVSLYEREYYGVQSVTEKKTIWIQNARTAEGKQIGSGSDSLAWVPIMVQDEVFAALAAGNFGSAAPITEEDVKDLEILASICGNFIDRTRIVVEPVAEKRVTTRFKYWIDPSEGYIVLEKKPEKSFEVFYDLVTHGIPGFVISRGYPDKIKMKYSLSKTPLLWLSRSEIENTLNPDDFSKLSYIVEDFTRKCEESVVLLDGIEYLVTQIGFTTVVRFLLDLKDIMVTNQSRLIIPLHKDAISVREYSLLEKEFRILLD